MRTPTVPILRPVHVIWLPPMHPDLVATEALLGREHPHNPLVLRVLRGDSAAEAELARRYDEMQPIWTAWTAEHQRYYVLPLELAVARLPAVDTLELSAGTGQATPLLASHSTSLICCEPVASMAGELAARHPELVVRAGAALPFRDGAFSRVAGLNAIMNAEEVRRVLRPDGVVVWCFSFAEATPVYVDPSELSDALHMHCEAQRCGPGLALTFRSHR